MFSTQQMIDASALILAAHESGFTRRQLIAELQAEFKCSGMAAGDLTNYLIEAGHCGDARESFYYTSPNYRW